MGVREVVDDLDKMLAVLPPHIRTVLEQQPNLRDLIEVVLDLGRKPEARFPGSYVFLSEELVTKEEIEYIVHRVGEFGRDNRAGIEGTLHRISCLRNRLGRIVGLTCRVGRAIFGTIDIIRDVVESGKSILLLGAPGLGKTTKLREIARVLADEFNKRVIVVDTSNEIAGDGDVPHPAIGDARRMQVPTPDKQHDVMIEAVENHMPEVIIIDEIGRAEETYAARTIAERGVQLIATAHGNTLENLIANPTLSDLVGGVQVVTLSDEEARRRGTQKTILERKQPPTFDVVIEMIDRDRLAIHHDTSKAVDAILQGIPPRPEIREELPTGEVKIQKQPVVAVPMGEGAAYHRFAAAPASPNKTLKLYSYGVSRKNIERAIERLKVPVRLTPNWQQADAIITLKSHLRKERGPLRQALQSGKEAFGIRSNTYAQVEQQLRDLFGVAMTPEEEFAIREAEEAVQQVLEYRRPVELLPHSPPLRKLQHQVAEKYRLRSESVGEDPMRRVIIYPS